MLAFSTVIQSKRNKRLVYALVPLNKVATTFPSDLIWWENSSVVPTVLAGLFSGLFPAHFKRLCLVLVLQTSYPNVASLGKVLLTRRISRCKREIKLCK